MTHTIPSLIQTQSQQSPEHLKGDFEHLGEFIEITKLNTSLAKQLQILLNNKGYDLIVDGIIGKKTVRAFRRFKERNKLNYPKAIGPLTLYYLNSLPKFIMPTKGRISSYYGYRIHPISGKKTFHTGIDIANHYGTPIKSSHEGRITLATYITGYGNTVCIIKENILTLYGHCKRLLVQRYDIVKQGEIIAEMGSSGNSTGSHLHFEIRRNNKHVNPMNYLIEKE